MRSTLVEKYDFLFIRMSLALWIDPRRTDQSGQIGVVGPFAQSVDGQELVQGASEGALGTVVTAPSASSGGGGDQ